MVTVESHWYDMKMPKNIQSNQLKTYDGSIPNCIDSDSCKIDYQYKTPLGQIAKV